MAGEAYYLWEDSNIDWLILQELPRARYVPHLEGSQFNDLIAECGEILTDMMKMLESKTAKIIEDLESGPEVVAELVTLQGEISPRPKEVVELAIETFVDLPTEPTLELVLSLTIMRALVFFEIAWCVRSFKSFFRNQFHRRLIP